MSADRETLAAYAARIADYRAFVSQTEPDGDLSAFMAALPAGGAVLDLGCGPGNSAAMMAARGFAVRATDAAPEMVAVARETYRVDAHVATFSDLDETAAYDGVWANFSLLHAPRAEMPEHLARIRRALRPGGLLHLGMKTGTGEARDALGRLYVYYGVGELGDLLAAAGFEVTAAREGRATGLTGREEPFVILRARRG